MFLFDGREMVFLIKSPDHECRPRCGFKSDDGTGGGGGFKQFGLRLNKVKVEGRLICNVLNYHVKFDKQLSYVGSPVQRQVNRVNRHKKSIVTQVFSIETSTQSTHILLIEKVIQPWPCLESQKWTKHHHLRFRQLQGWSRVLCWPFPWKSWFEIGIPTDVVCEIRPSCLRQLPIALGTWWSFVYWVLIESR